MDDFQGLEDCRLKRQGNPISLLTKAARDPLNTVWLLTIRMISGDISMTVNKGGT